MRVFCQNLHSLILCRYCERFTSVTLFLDVCCAVPRGGQFEAEAELHEKISGLQQELAAFKEQYAALLEKVDQQHRLIRQLSEADGGQASMDTAAPPNVDQQEDNGTRPICLEL